jgi:fructokinase
LENTLNKKALHKGRPVIFGEVLFDHFPDGSAVLGGAPFNVAWHLQGFGYAPLFISRVGEDGPGHRVKRAMENWGLDSTGVQTDAHYPTGMVEVRFEGAQHSFHILPDQAYDHIDAELTQKAIGAIEPTLLYHGTLIARTQANRQVLDELLTVTKTPIFIDVNLRDPWWHEDHLTRLLKRATGVKVNDEELIRVAKRLGLRADNIEGAARSIHAHYQLDSLIVTLGAQGAMTLDSSQQLVRVGPDQDLEVIDTVGAGDAFASVVLLGLLEGWTTAITLQRAQGFASRICTQRGATSADLEMYRELMRGWTADKRSSY